MRKILFISTIIVLLSTVSNARECKTGDIKGDAFIYSDGKKVKIVKRLKKSVNRRQDSPKVYDMNASIYIWKRKEPKAFLSESFVSAYACYGVKLCNDSRSPCLYIF